MLLFVVGLVMLAFSMTLARLVKSARADNFEYTLMQWLARFTCALSLSVILIAPFDSEKKLFIMFLLIGFSVVFWMMVIAGLIMVQPKRLSTTERPLI